MNRALLAYVIFALSVSFGIRSFAESTIQGRQYIRCTAEPVQAVSVGAVAPRYDHADLDFMWECTAPKGDRFARHFVDPANGDEVIAVYSLEDRHLVEYVVAKQKDCSHDANGYSICMTSNGQHLQIDLNAGVMVFHSN